MSILTLLARLRRDERGLALVEMALGLPLMLLVLAVTVEGGRLFYSYQAVVQGVRDASRYVGRVVPSDLCSTGGTIGAYISDHEVRLLVERNANVSAVFPPAITVLAVEVASRCEGAVGVYRISPAPIAQITARLEVEFPFSGVVRFATGSPAGTITTTITDEARIFGS